MKVGLLTLTPSHNYGGILQAIALSSFLEGMGHTVVLIDKRLHRPLWKKLVFKAFEVFPFQNFRNIRGDFVKARQFKAFIELNIPRQSRKVVTLRDMELLVKSERFDAVVVGSDQVWRYQYIKDGYHTLYFLNFDVDFPVRKIAYAASFGKDEWEVPGSVEEISKLLKKFDAVSTRESSGVAVCKNTFGVGNTQHVLDPTLIVGEEFYDRFFLNFDKKGVVKTIVTYILDENKEKDQVVVELKNNLEEEGVEYKEVNLFKKKEGGKYYSVEEWLWEIKNASFVVTDSFHGMVFSILFRRQFVVIGNSGRGMSRFNSLLGLFGLEARLVSDYKNPPRITDKIDYERVMTEYNRAAAMSREFLNKALS